MKKYKKFNQGMFDYIDNSPTAFQATAEAVKILEKNGFKELLESDSWNLEVAGKYYVTRNASSLIAFTLGENFQTAGFNILGAHTDSPALKVKPNSISTSENYAKVEVEPYGGGLWYTWFDRQLSLAGRVGYLDADNNLKFTNIDLKKAIAVIPSIAPHLHKSLSAGRELNKQNDLPPILQLSDKVDFSFEDFLVETIEGATKIMSFELFFYPLAPCCYSGLNDDFVLAPRLDNLMSCYCSIQALLGATSRAMIVLNDHEECGSNSTSGAGGNFLEIVLKRIADSEENFAISNSNSLVISADNAHAVHPNIGDRHEKSHKPKLNAGTVLKINSNQRYASNVESLSLIKSIASQESLPLQTFVCRSDLGCGSTIGPVTAARLGIKTIDIGAPTLAMHSTVELTGLNDPYNIYELITKIFA